MYGPPLRNPEYIFHRYLRNPLCQKHLGVSRHHKLIEAPAEIIRIDTNQNIENFYSYMNLRKPDLDS